MNGFALATMCVFVCLPRCYDEYGCPREKTAKEKRLLLLHEKKSASLDSPYDFDKTHPADAAADVYYDAHSSFHDDKNADGKNVTDGSPYRCVVVVVEKMMD